MGLFDNLKKITEDLGKEIEKGVKSEEFQKFKDAMKNVAESAGNFANANSSSNLVKEIPEEYNEFPRFRDVADSVEERKTDKYIRCTMDYSSVTESDISEYVSKIISLGYIKGSNVRFDKDNTYIIVEEVYNGLHLVFHIKR